MRFRNWNVDEFLMVVLKFALIVAVVISTAVVLVGYAYLMFAYHSPVWWITTAVALVVAGFIGADINKETHRENCHRLTVPDCEKCEADEEINEILVAVAFESQEKLDEMLSVFGGRVAAACAEQDVLNRMDSGKEKITPTEELKRQRLTHMIGRYHRGFKAMQKHAPRFKLVVAEGWSAYFPERPAA